MANHFHRTFSIKVLEVKDIEFLTVTHDPSVHCMYLCDLWFQLIVWNTNNFCFFFFRCYNRSCVSYCTFHYASLCCISLGCGTSVHRISGILYTDIGHPVMQEQDSESM